MLVIKIFMFNKLIFCTLLGRTGGYPDYDLIKLKKKKKKDKYAIGDRGLRSRHSLGQN